ncbi:adenylate/guanylate cyclase domain-containing protein [Rhodobacteraceae bacterium R_SAG7]|nr:adenylate/guanylate cyclase domain-containing protein [Rhodobacteraceae bacterium R_SAG7]
MRDMHDLNQWLVADGRLTGDATKIVGTYCSVLVSLGVPLTRVRIAQSYLNPLLSAWGIIWTPEKTERYTVRATVLDTSAWRGSPFEYVINTGKTLRQRLKGQDLSKAHSVYADLAATGATDFLSVPLAYGDGSIQGTSFTTHAEAGFSNEHIGLIEGSRHALAAALEPVAMRESQTSLLSTYLGGEPAREIGLGKIKRGEHKTMSAAIIFADMRGFTRKSGVLSEERLLTVMGNYFEMVVSAIQDNGGVVLKFMGDGILAYFNGDHDADSACEAAAASALQSLSKLKQHNTDEVKQGREPIDFVIGVDFGEVTFGNIGSPDRLDFTVVGQAVNVASRIQDMCKTLGRSTLLTKRVADRADINAKSIGLHSVRGIPVDIELFTLA